MFNFWYGNIYSSYLGTPNDPKQYQIPGSAGSIDLAPIPLDTDTDGILDWYEQLYGLDEFTNDSALDPDGDGYTNLEEFFLGMDPFVNDVIPVSPETTTEIITTTLPASSTTIISETSTQTETVTTTSVITETLTKTAEGFGLVLLAISFIALIVSRRKT